MKKNKAVDLSQFNFGEFQEEAIFQLKSGQPLTGKDGMLTPLIKQILEAVLDGEMESHLTDYKEEGHLNRRNGLQSKTIKSGFGCFELDTPAIEIQAFSQKLSKIVKIYI